MWALHRSSLCGTQPHLRRKLPHPQACVERRLRNSEERRGRSVCRGPAREKAMQGVWYHRGRGGRVCPKRWSRTDGLNVSQQLRSRHTITQTSKNPATACKWKVKSKATLTFLPYKALQPCYLLINQGFCGTKILIKTLKGFHTKLIIKYNCL